MLEAQAIDLLDGGDIDIKPKTGKKLLYNGHEVLQANSPSAIEGKNHN